MKVVLSRAAKASLREIALYIARDNPVRARSFVAELRAKAVDTGDIPRAFPLVPHYEQYGIRRRPFGSYLIFYRVEASRVVIVDIIHGARHYEALLFPNG
jgi:plasmid stabilization system protein ParE